MCIDPYTYYIKIATIFISQIFLLTKYNLTMDIATGLISSLFNIAYVFFPTKAATVPA